MLIVFDLDGTLVCARHRLYRLFCDLAGEGLLSFEQYWAAKFKNLKHSDILQGQFLYSQTRYEAFEEQWMSLIEDDRYLAFDTLIPGVLEHLEVLRQYADLYLCTARQSSAQANAQLSQLGLSPLFKAVLVTEKVHSKEQLLTDHLPDLGKRDWFVGDTGSDIRVGKSLGMSTCAVLSGFCDKQYLNRYAPDRLVGNVVEFMP